MDSNKYIEHLLTQLEEQNRSLWREKLAVARLQREIAQRRNEGAAQEKLIRDLEEERRLRLQSEKRLQEVTLESERGRAQMRGLQQQLSRMEETVRNLLQSQGHPGQSKEEASRMMLGQEKLPEEERKHKEVLEDFHVVVDEDSRSEGSNTDEEKEKTKLLLERLKALEAENSALALENESQREEYERCLDEVANQVVQALLTQKDLREECVKLKTRVFDLEQQNRTLSILFQQRVRPTPDLLFQKLHSRILDLSAGDLLSEVERSQSLTPSRTDVRMHECQLNAKSAAPRLRCHGLGVVIPGHPCPRNSCSSSDLSLSSTCSEYSSGSSNTWHDSKSLRKRQSLRNWDKRLSIDTSLLSGLASPTDELPPARIKESHVLEGLGKLQTRRVLLEPPSVIAKWGYKDCMNSNEGIYSPGIKSSAPQGYPVPPPPGTGAARREHQKTFAYDTDSQEDTEEDASFFATLPHQTIRAPGCTLTHSVSDSLFSWELSGKYLLEGTPSVHPREQPEKPCPVMGRGVRSAREQGLQSLGPGTLPRQLSDTDDNEPLDELHIGSSDEKSPSDLSLAADTDRSTENLDTLLGLGPAGTQLDSRSKTFSFGVQQRPVSRTSPEERITVIWDAEDREAIELSPHQTSLISISQEGHTQLSPQEIAHSQPEAASRAWALFKRTEDGKEENIPEDDADRAAAMSADALIPREVAQNAQRRKLATPAHSASCQNSARSLVASGLCQKQSLSKTPAQGESNTAEPDVALRVPTSVPITPERSPALTPGKPPRFKKMEEGLVPPFDFRSDSHIPKLPPAPPHDSSIPCRRDRPQYLKRQTPASRLLSRPVSEPREDGKPPARERPCEPGLEAVLTASAPPVPPGRSVSLLLRPADEYVSPSSSSAFESRVPLETVRAGFKSPLLKGPSAPGISSKQTRPEMQAKKPSVAFRKPPSTVALLPTETGLHTRCSAHTRSGSFPMGTTAPTKGSPKRGLPRTPPHLVLGTTQIDSAGLRAPKNCPTAHEPQEAPSPKSVPPGIESQRNDSVSTSASGARGSPLSQGSSPSPSPPPHGYQSAREKGLKTRLPVGLKVLMRSPPLLRKSSTVPGKQEKDSLNEASKSCVAASQSAAQSARGPPSPEVTGPENNGPALCFQAGEGLGDSRALDAAAPASPGQGLPGAGHSDGLANRSVKRSLSSHKPHLKPALGMNGAKARSQSFSSHSGDKPPAPAPEGAGKVRTQIITNTAERGNSLTRQASSAEASPHRTPAAPSADRSLGPGPCGQGSLDFTDSSNSQHRNPSKLPLRVLPKSGGSFTPQTEALHSSSLASTGVATPEGPASGCRCPSTPTGCPHALQDPGKTQKQAGNFEPGRSSKVEVSGQPPGASPTRTASPETPLSPTIEEKVMLCIQENAEKGQVQTKSSSVDAKPKAGPSFASWFGIRRSKLPALSSSRKMDFSRLKAEKKEAKGLGPGSRQLKSERKKERKKSELRCEADRELGLASELPASPDGVFSSKFKPKTPQDIYSQGKVEPRNRSRPVTCPTRDTFMTELLSRVDKNTAHQAGCGANSVACRSVAKRSPQGSCHASSAVSVPGSHKKCCKTKAEVEFPEDSPIKEAKENLPEDEDDAAADASFQSHIIESNRQMRTLDSGIGTFPLPDSGTRSAGRHLCQPDSPEDSEPTLPRQPSPCSASSIRAQTLDREVPSSAGNVIVHPASDPILTTRGLGPLQSRLPKPASSGKLTSPEQTEAEPRPRACSSFDYAENTAASESLLDRGSEDRTAETQDRGPRMCAYSAGGGSESESEPDVGSDGFGVGRGELVKPTKRAIPEVGTS